MSPSEKRELSISELLKCSFIIIDKPRGPSSHEVAAWVRKLAGTNKSGHSGTLDPNVSGVLPVGIGKATKLLPFLTTRDKKYVCLMRTKRALQPQEFLKMFKQFEGTITQTPPRESAVAKRPRQRKVFYINAIHLKPNKALFEVHCEAGTYIRVLVSDFGRICGGAEMLELRRIAVGAIPESKAMTLQDLSDAIWAARRGEESALRRSLIPPQEALSLRKVVLRDSAVEAVCAGAPLYAPGFSSCDEGIEPGEPVSLLTQDGRFIGVGRASLPSEEMGAHSRGQTDPGQEPWARRQREDRGGVVRPRDSSGVICTPETIVMERGTFPKWGGSQKND